MSGVISKRRLSRVLVMGAAVTALSACSQMTKHSNMLVFGTNTSVGVNVGKDASQSPTIQIGINRQEVALVPLLANTKQSTKGQWVKELAPCPADTKTPDGKGLTGIDLEGCKFVATSTETEYKFKDDGTPVVDGSGKQLVSTKRHSADSYSTLASFGTRSSGNEQGASVAVAQYFATGVAAQKLAEDGGASVVQADSNSGKAAEAEKEKAKADQEKAKAAQMEAVAKAAEANKEFDTGYAVALYLMGNDETEKVANKSSELEDIAGKPAAAGVAATLGRMGPACQQKDLDRLLAAKSLPDLSSANLTVKQLLDTIRADQPNCFDNFIS